MAGDTNTQLDTQARRAFVLEMRKAGASYRQIAQMAVEKFGTDALPNGWDCRYASKDVGRELDKLKSLNQDQAEDIRELELERLDAIQSSIWGDVRKGHLGAIDRILKVMKRRAELLGLDSATKVHSLDIDLSTLTENQLERLAAGEDLISVLATPGTGGA